MIKYRSRLRAVAVLCHLVGKIGFSPACRLLFMTKYRSHLRAVAVQKSRTLYALIMLALSQSVLIYLLN